MILGLDLGRYTGVAMVGSMGEPVALLRWRFEQDSHGELIYDFFDRLRDMIRETNPLLVAFEDLTGNHMPSTAWRSIWFGMRSAVMIACEEAEVSYVGVTVPQWKAEFGVPTRGKHPVETLAAARAYCGEAWIGDVPAPMAENDDEAAALLVAVTAHRAGVV
jgi:hypothetical protein